MGLPSRKLRSLSVCTGFGCDVEALAPWLEPAAYCENDPAKQSLLVSRMLRGELPTAPIWDDLRSLRGAVLPSIDAIHGGFPCTDISLAGDRAGLAGERSGLIWEIVRLTQELSPGIVFVENVWPGIRKFVPAIRAAFEELGMEVRDGVLAASDLGAWHRRERFFLLAADPYRLKLWLQSGRRQTGGQEASLSAVSLESGVDPNSSRMPLGLPGPEGRLENFDASQSLENGNASDADADGEGVAFGRKRLGPEPQQPFSLDLLEGNNGDEYAAFLLGMDSGRPLRGHRIRALGDCVPPIVYQEAFKRLAGISMTPACVAAQAQMRLAL